MKITDAQVHIWPADTPERPWPEYGKGYAHGDELLADEMLVKMDEAGVDRAVDAAAARQRDLRVTLRLGDEVVHDRRDPRAVFRIECTGRLQRFGQRRLLLATAFDRPRNLRGADDADLNGDIPKEELFGPIPFDHEGLIVRQGSGK